MTMLWSVFAVMVVAVLAALVNPLLKGRPDAAPKRVDYDFIVYRDQLKEIDEEVERALLTETQAHSARAEVHRRMLAAEKAAPATAAKLQAGADAYWRIGPIAAICLFLPIGAGMMYGALGSPKLPGQSYAWRVSHNTGFAAIAASDTLAAKLQQAPNAAGYRRLAQLYFNNRDYKGAAAADRRAIELGSKDSLTWSELGEALVMENDGAVVPEALQAFTIALEMDTRSERSRFYIGLAEAQIGNLKRAVSIWRDLERTSDPNAAWMAMLREHITGFAKRGGFDPASVQPSSPSIQSMNTAIAAMKSAVQTQSGATTPAAESLGPSDPNDMIRSMVARLAARMETTPEDLAGWQRLAHSYLVLGERDKAREAISHAVRLRPADVDVLLALAETEKAGTGPQDAQPADFTATMRNVLKLAPENTEALYYVGLAERKLGHADAARAMWIKALSNVSANGVLVQSIRSQLDREVKKGR